MNMETIINFIKNLNGQNLIDLIIAIVIFAVLDIISPIFSYIILKLFNFKKTKKEIKNNTLYMPLRVFFKVTGAYIAILFLKPTFNFSDNFLINLTKIYKILVTITIANSLANSITRKSKFLRVLKEKSDKDLNDSTIKILVRIIRVIIYIIAVFIIFAEIGYDLSGLVTGLGLGSVVLTLAVQDTIKNLLGGIIIFMDKPFSVGEYIKFNNYQGTVEDMTLRSTRIRTLDDALVQIPNSLIVSSAVEDLSKIKRRRYNLEFEMVLNTEIEKIEILKEKIYENLMQNENVFKDTINVHFTEVGTNGFKMIVICYFNVSDYMEFLDLKEELNKDIMRIIKKENIELAFDIRTVEIKR